MAEIAFNITGLDPLKEFAETLKKIQDGSGPIASVWATIKKDATETASQFEGIGKNVDDVSRKTNQFAEALSNVARSQEKITKSQQEGTKSSGTTANNFANMKKHATGVASQMLSVFNILRTMATGGGGLGGIGQAASIFGRVGGPAFALAGGALAASVTAIGASVKAALDYRAQAAAAAGYGVQNPFATQAYGNYLTMYTGGEAGTAALFGQIANQQTTLGGPEFQRNWARRFGVAMKAGQRPEDLAESQLRAEFNMANRVRPELWKAAAQAFNVGDVVDMNRLWRLKGASGTEFQEELAKARKAAEEAKLGETPDKRLKEAAEEWSKVGLDFKVVVDKFGAWVSALAGNQLAKDIDELLQHLSKGDWKWSDIFGRRATPEEVKKLHDQQKKEDIENFGHTFEGWSAPFQWGWEELKRGAGGLLNWFNPISPAKAGELPEGVYPPSFDMKDTVGKAFSDALKPDALGWGVTEKTISPDEKARLGPYNLLAAAKIPDNIQEIRDILARTFPIGGLDGAAGFGGTGVPLGIRLRGSGKSFGANTLWGGEKGTGGLTLAASKNMTPEERAILDVIALREAAPGKSYLSEDPDRGAAFQGNRYQFLGPTWAKNAREIGADPKDLSPENQDRVALHLAKKLIGNKWAEALKNPSILISILGPTWHGVWNVNTASAFQKALEAEKARKLKEADKPKSTDITPPSVIHNERVSAKEKPIAPGWENIVGRETPEGEAYKRRHRDWMEHYRHGDRPEEKVSYGQGQMPQARRAPSQFVNVHVNNTTGAEVAINAWQAVPQPAYVS